MNVYFVNPTYVKPEGWAPLLAYLKVKAAYSFIPEEELPDSLYSIIKPYLKASYSNQDLKKFSDNCVFWLRAHFEKHIRLITEDYDDIRNASKEDLKKYSSRSALNNLKYLDDNNCLILTKLESAIESLRETISLIKSSNAEEHTRIFEELKTLAQRINEIEMQVRLFMTGSAGTRPIEDNK